MINAFSLTTSIIPQQKKKEENMFQNSASIQYARWKTCYKFSYSWRELAV